MFPQSFNARVAERMAIWGAMLGFLLLLYVGTEIIQARQMEQISEDRHHATVAAMAHVTVDATRFASAEQRVEAGKKAIGAIEAINERQASFAANHRQNKVLLMLLMLF